MLTLASPADFALEDFDTVEGALSLGLGRARLQPDERLATTLAHRRLKARLNVQVAAKKSGVSASYIYHLEDERVTVPARDKAMIGLLLKLAKTYDWDIREALHFAGLRYIVEPDFETDEEQKRRRLRELCVERGLDPVQVDGMPKSTIETICALLTGPG